MGIKTYLPQFASTMHYLAKYIFDHRTTLYKTIDADPRISDEEKQKIKEIADQIVASHETIRQLHLG